jgi:hypothetical protein
VLERQGRVVQLAQRLAGDKTWWDVVAWW